MGERDAGARQLGRDAEWLRPEPREHDAGVVAWPWLDGLSDALFWLGELETSLHHRSRAFGMYREAGDLCRAARAALWLAMGYISGYGNAAVANGWLQRAERLLDEAGPCSERGWFEQLRGKMTPDPAATARHAHQAVEIARQHRDARS